MKLGGYTATGPRDANEDSFYFRSFSEVKGFPEGIEAFVMVSDGMGGYEGGDVASGLAVSSAENYLSQIIEMASGNEIELDAPAALGEIAQNAHEAIMAESRERGNASMGATFIGAFLSQDHAWIGHIGDSRAYLIRNGKATQLTEDHSQVGRMLSRGLITEEEAQNHPARNRIERALGFSGGAPELTEFDLVSGDVLLLCSDGVYTVLNAEAIGECAAAARGAGNMAKRIVKSAIGKGTDDNSTAVVALNAPDDDNSSRVRQPTMRTEAVALAPRHAQPTLRLPPRSQNQSRERLREGATSQARRPSHTGKKQSGRPVWAIVVPVVVAVLLIGLLVGFFVGSGGLGVGGGVQAEPAQGDANPTAIAAQGQQAIEPAATTDSAQATSTGNTALPNGQKATFEVTGSALLKYLDGSGQAQNFSGDDEAPFSAEGAVLYLQPGAAVEATEAASSYKREPNEYRMLDDKYLRALQGDVADFTSGIRTLNSDLSRIAGDGSYQMFVEAIATAPNSNFGAVQHLLVFAEDLS